MRIGSSCLRVLYIMIENCWTLLRDTAKVSTVKYAELVAALIRGSVDKVLTLVISGAKTVTCQSNTGGCRLMMSAQSQSLSHCTG